MNFVYNSHQLLVFAGNSQQAIQHIYARENNLNEESNLH